jgi:hypothetical protein
MKKYTLIAAFLGLITGVKAQSYTMDKDTSKLPWVFPGYEIEPHISFTNTTSAAIKFSWKMTVFYKDDKWKFNGACDNVLCYTQEVPGLTDGTKTFITDPVAPGEKLDFKMLFNGNEAASPTKSVGTIEIWTGSEAPKKATFIGYKGTTGIKTFLLTNNDDIMIFPNPASTYIDIVYSPASDAKTIVLYNLIGKIVNTYEVTGESSTRCTFNAAMPSGIYMVRVTDSKENIIAIRKITHQ